MAHIRSLFFKGPLADIEDKALTAYRLGRPSEVIWNITDRCNLLCDHCYMSADGSARADQLSAAQAMDVVRQIGEAQVPLLFLTGGEPLMRPDFWELLAAARGYGIRVTVSTNATMIDSTVARRLKTHGIDWVATSLYGPADFHDRMVGVGGTHQRVVRAIRTLREHGVGVALKSAVSRSTWPHLPGLIATAKDLDCGLIYLCDLIASGRSAGEDETRVTAAEWRALADDILEDVLASEDGLEYDIGALPSVIPYLAERLTERGIDVSRGLERLRTMSACPVGKGHMNINSSGGVMPCQFAQDWTVGDIREMSLMEATRALFELDRPEAKGRCAPDSCEYSRICRGCRTKAWQATGDPMAEDTTCILRGAGAEPEPRAPASRQASSCCAPGACG